MRKTAYCRPTTYHSSAAVLIIADKENSSAEGIKNFFKGLNSKSDVTLINHNNASRMENELVEMEWLRQWKGRRMQTEEEELRKEIKKKKGELQKEIENITTAVSAVIDRWIHNQGWSRRNENILLYTNVNLIFF